MNIYTKDGWLDMANIIKQPYPFIVIIGARGTGKTYSSLKYAYESETPFILMRTTEKEVKLCSNEAGNPFKSLNRDMGWNVSIEKINDFMYGIYKEKGSSYIGLTMALTNFSRVRGLDLTDIKLILYDEFIPEKIVKKINGIGEAILQAYETVSRNRELKGEEPLKLVMMANALNLNNEVLIHFGIPSMLNKMKKKGLEVMQDDRRGILLINPHNSPISEAKQNTALYRINQRFNEMALDNKFRDFYENNISSRNIKNFIPIVRFDNMYFLKSKTSRDIYVSTFAPSGYKIEAFENTDFEKKQFIKKYSVYIQKYFSNHILFENAELELAFINLFNI